MEAPSYYFTKPAADPRCSRGGGGGGGADGSQRPPDGAQRFSRRVRGIAAVALDSPGVRDHHRGGGGGPAVEGTEPASAPPYRMITKRIGFRRSTLPRSARPALCVFM